MKPVTSDRVIRVFVSSTFRDMVEDRNELMSHVWPALRKVCRERAVEFVEMDLRWGVTEATGVQVQVYRLQVAGRMDAGAPPQSTAF